MGSGSYMNPKKNKPICAHWVSVPSHAIINIVFLYCSDYTMCTVQKEAEEKSFVQGTTKANSNPQVP